MYTIIYDIIYTTYEKLETIYKHLKRYLNYKFQSTWLNDVTILDKKRLAFYYIKWFILYIFLKYTSTIYLSLSSSTLSNKWDIVLKYNNIDVYTSYLKSHNQFSFSDWY